MLEEQRSLLALIEGAERAHSRGDQEAYVSAVTSLGSALGTSSSPVVPHVHARLRRLEDRPLPARRRRTELDTKGLFGRLHPEMPPAIRALGAPEWSARNRTSLDSAVRDRLHWWSCGQSKDHAEWLATVWQVMRGRPCPACLHESGLHRSAWRPRDIHFAISELPGEPGPGILAHMAALAKWKRDHYLE